MLIIANTFKDEFRQWGVHLQRFHQFIYSLVFNICTCEINVMQQDNSFCKLCLLLVKSRIASVVLVSSIVAMSIAPYSLTRTSAYCSWIKALNYWASIFWCFVHTHFSNGVQSMLCLASMSRIFLQLQKFHYLRYYEKQYTWNHVIHWFSSSFVLTTHIKRSECCVCFQIINKTQIEYTTTTRTVVCICCTWIRAIHMSHLDVLKNKHPKSTDFHPNTFMASPMLFPEYVHPMSRPERDWARKHESFFKRTCWFHGTNETNRRPFVLRNCSSIRPIFAHLCFLLMQTPIAMFRFVSGSVPSQVQVHNIVQASALHQSHQERHNPQG